MANKSPLTRLSDLPTADRKTGDLNAIAETPRNSRIKFSYDPERDLLKVSALLPEGASFPFNFGFLPSTLGADGDPLDVLILMEEAVAPGCLVPARLIGVIEAEQTEHDGKTTRNDRLIAVASSSRQHSDVDSYKKVPDQLAKEVEHFFVSYNEMRGKRFKPLGCFGPSRARKLLKAGQERFRRTRRRKS